MPRSPHIAFAAAALVALAALPHASARPRDGFLPWVMSEKYDQSIRWRSIRTPHFWIHFPRGMERTAERLAAIAEEEHGRLAPAIGWKPRFRTDVVLVNSTDEANGMTTLMPWNRIVIYAARPESNSSMDRADDWLRIVFVHEYAHVLDTDMVRGLPLASRFIMGRLIFPNMFLPAWSVEGSAVLRESSRGAGRANSAYTDMVLRADAAAGRFRGIADASHFPRDWPQGEVPYLYGGMFLKYLEERFGEGSLARFLRFNADNIIPFSDNIYPIPYFFNRDAKKVYGKSFAALWKEWRAALDKRYAAQIDAVRAAGETEYRALSRGETSAYYPRFSADGKRVYYVRYTPRGPWSLVRRDLGGGEEVLCRLNYPNSLSVAPDGSAVLSDLELVRSFNRVREAFRYDGRYRRLTRALHGSGIALSRDGTRAAFVSFDGERYSLETAGPDLSGRKAVIAGSALHLSHPAFSPGGDRLVFTARDSAGRVDLFMVDLSDGKSSRLTNDDAVDGEAVWHPDGKRIVFSSDRGGIYNLFELDTANGALRRITNMTGGAFSPDVTRDGKLIVFSSYTGAGMVAAYMDYPARAFSGESVSIQGVGTEFFSPKETEKTGGAGEGARRYNPFRSALPSYWVPAFHTDELPGGGYDCTFGAVIDGNDTLNRHFWEIAADFAAVQRRMTLDVSYCYSGLYPDLLLGYYDEALYPGGDTFPWGATGYRIIRESVRYGYAGISVPWNRFNLGQSISLYYLYEQQFLDTYNPLFRGYDRYIGYYPSPGKTRRRHLFGRVQASYRLGFARAYPYSISREDGGELTLRASVFQRWLGSEGNFYRLSGEYAHYLPGFVQNHVLMARVRGGITRGDRNGYLGPYYLGRYETGSTFSPPTGEDAWGLRGYRSSGIYGENIAAATAEYRFPIVQKDAGVMTVPVYFRDLWMAVFFDCGNVWYGTSWMRGIRCSAGAELHLGITAGYEYDIDGFLGYARGFDPGGENQVYFGVSGLLEGRILNRHSALNRGKKI